ncbi:winged helix-turn-helix transcriptional regulator [Candidatus Bathyarchaeota archaeon]|nr:winged helix-turn-helix transcriptional regulator [Candidatus Bathyarchaeota archaeon]
MVFIPNERSVRYILGWLIAGTRGGTTRAEIIQALKRSPQNANQLSNILGRDYRTIRHHLEILKKNGIVTCTGDRYGVTYFLSSTMEENYMFFEDLLKKIWKSNNKGQIK